MKLYIQHEAKGYLLDIVIDFTGKYPDEPIKSDRTYLLKRAGIMLFVKDNKCIAIGEVVDEPV